MITDAFDDKSPAKINVKKSENAVQVDAVIFTFSQEIEKYVIAQYDCEKSGNTRWPLELIPSMYLITMGRNMVSVRHG